MDKMEINKNVRRIQKSFYDSDFTDSIIESLRFDNRLVNFIVTVDYYFTESDVEIVELIFENCTMVDYEIPQEIYKMNDDILNASHFTIVKTSVAEMDNQVCIKIFTADYDREFLKILCQDVRFISKRMDNN